MQPYHFEPSVQYFAVKYRTEVHNYIALYFQYSAESKYLMTSGNITNHHAFCQFVTVNIYIYIQYSANSMQRVYIVKAYSADIEHCECFVGKS